MEVLLSLSPFPTPSPLLLFFRSSDRRWMSLFAQPSVVSGGFSCWEASGWTMWAPCWLALRIVSAARLRSIAGGRTMGTSSPSWKGRIQGTARGTPASTSRTSQGTSLPCKSAPLPAATPSPRLLARRLLSQAGAGPAPAARAPGSLWLEMLRAARAGDSGPVQWRSGDA